MPSVPVYRFAKVPKLNVNEQGIPLKTGNKPQSVKTPKYPKKGKAPASEPEPEPMADEERQTGDQPYAGTYTPAPAPQRPFNELQEDTFPIAQLGRDAEGMVNYLTPEHGEHGPKVFAEWAAENGGYGDDSISRALQIISAAGQTHGINNSNRVRQDSAKHSTLPVGHVRVAPLIPGLDHHIVHIHHPEGTITSYRAKVNEDNTGYS